MAQIKVLFKDKQLKIHQLTDDEAVIGSDRDCNIFIDSLAIKPQHAIIIGKTAHPILRVIHAENPVLIDGKETIEAQLSNGDVFVIGKHTFVFEAEEDSSEQKSESIFKHEKKQDEAWLQILSGPNLGKTINLHRKLTNIGKAGVQLEVIAHRGEGYFISHLEGIYIPTLNGEPIGESSHKLNHGDIIVIGKIELLFSIA